MMRLVQAGINTEVETESNRIEITVKIVGVVQAFKQVAITSLFAVFLQYVYDNKITKLTVSV